MEENAKATTYAVAQLDLKETIVKLEDVYPIIQLAQNLVEMGHVSQIIHAFVSPDGLDDCAIKTNHGLD